LKHEITIIFINSISTSKETQGINLIRQLMQSEETPVALLFSDNYMKGVTILTLKRSIRILIAVFEGLNSPPQDSERSASSPYKQPLVHSEDETAGIQTRSGRSGDEERNILHCSKSNHRHPDRSLIILLTDHF